MKQRGRRQGRACVVGLDGVPYSLVKRFCEDGTWPFVAELARAGALSRMKVTLPEISAVSWPSFMTGSNPGVHGIFGFTELTADYSLRFTNFSDLRVPTFWDELGRKGKRSVVINQPGTYPARDIPGVLISGFVALELARAVRPLRYLAFLRRTGYEIDIDTQRCRRDHDQLFRELDRTLEARRSVTEHLWEEEDWDYFQVVITGTDRLQHYLMDAVEDPAHPRHEAAIAYYRRVENFLREMWERCQRSVEVSREGEGFFLLSDHGFCLIRQEVFLNAFLQEKGWLRFEKEPPESMADISAEARAFCLDPGRIYLHRADRFQKGRVRAEEVPELRRRLREELLSLSYEGEPVLAMVKEREEIYHGPETENGPDLVCVPRPGFDLKGQAGKAEVFGRSDLTGMHTWDDAFCWSRDAPGGELEITQLAEIITRSVLSS